MIKWEGMKKRSQEIKQQVWEKYSRRSVECANSANGWLKAGYTGITEERSFFCPGILQ